MNILQDGTAWILPPRTASRWTVSLLWKYGLIHFGGHKIDKGDDEPKKIVMNIRHPYSRFYSFWRMVTNRTVGGITLDDYIWNLIEEVVPIEFTSDVDWKEPLLPDLFRYPVPLFVYTNTLHPWKVDHFVRVEHMVKDLDAAGYPVRDHKWEPKGGYAPAQSTSYADMVANEKYLDVIDQFYKVDLAEFNYMR
jgi:hypothetical protein